MGTKINLLKGIILSLVILILPVNSFCDEILAKWQIRHRATRHPEILHSVTYGSGIFVAVGQGGAIYTSRDGAEWNRYALDSVNDIYDITYGNGLFVAVGDDGLITTSSDGKQWTVQKKITPKHQPLESVTYGKGLFIALGSGGGGIAPSRILISSDGKSWRVLDVYDLNLDLKLWELGTFDFRDIAFGNGTFVISCSRGYVLTSSDGITWALRSTGGVGTIGSLAYGNGQFVTKFGIESVLTSVDGIVWHKQRKILDGLDKVILGDNTYMARKYSDRIGKMAILLSNDGKTWFHSMYMPSIGRFTYCGGKFIIAGDKGIILSSIDGITWKSWFSGTVDDLYDVACNEDTYVAVGQFGTIIQTVADN